MAQTTTRREWEARYVSQYLIDTFPDAVTMHRVPLGDIPESMTEDVGTVKAAKYFRPSRPVADAIAIETARLVLIEGKIFDPNRALGQILFYSRLLQFTPELQEYKDLPVTLQVVTARAPPWASHAEAFSDIEIVVYQPEWIQEYYEHLQSYWTQASRLKRQIRKTKLEALGW